jgi:hypothetical protein
MVCGSLWDWGEMCGEFEVIVKNLVSLMTEFTTEIGVNKPTKFTTPKLLFSSQANDFSQVSSLAVKFPA